jgi:hypothetical protein
MTKKQRTELEVSVNECSTILKDILDTVYESGKEDWSKETLHKVLIGTLRIYNNRFAKLSDVAKEVATK